MSARIRVKRDSSGRRYVQPYLGTNKVTGRRIRPYRSFPDSMSDEEVEEEARRWVAEQRAALSLGASLRLGDQLLSYVEWKEAEQAPANTCRTYRTIVDNYLLGLAGIDPRSVTTAMVVELYHELMLRGGEHGQPLSPNTVIGVHQFLRRAYGWLIERGICETNPVLDASKPKLVPHEAISLEEDELFRMFDLLDAAIREDAEGRVAARRRMHLFAAWLALHTGMRVGECCGLRRTDVQLTASRLVVRGTAVDARGGVERQPFTKGKRPRTVAITPKDAIVIAEHLAWQAELLGGRDSKRTVVSSLDGGVCSPRAVSRTFTEFAREAGLPAGVTFHSLRHTHGTWLIMRGIDVKTVSERLGHADVATTMRIYAHVLPGRDEAAARAFSEIEHGSRTE